MAVDPQCRAVLEMMTELPDLSTMSVDAARALFEGFPKPPNPTSVHSIEDTFIPRSFGRLPIRIYRPSTPRPGVFVYFHGGGWVLGSLDTHDEICRKLSAASGLAVVSVAYRRAPEAPFPIPVEDCHAATLWLYEHGAELGLDATQLAFGGESAGANLALAVAQMLRDRNEPMPCLQVLICPIADCDFSTESYTTYATGYFLTRQTMMWFWDHYIPDAAQRMSPYASPLRAAQLSGLPPTLLITAELDPLRDEGEKLARRLAANHVDVTHERYDGVFHGFVGFSTILDKANIAIERIARAAAAACSKSST